MNIKTVNVIWRLKGFYFEKHWKRRFEIIKTKPLKNKVTIRKMSKVVIEPPFFTFDNS